MQGGLRVITLQGAIDKSPILQHPPLAAQKLKKRFYNRETIPFIKISQFVESPSTLSWLAKIL